MKKKKKLETEPRKTATIPQKDDEHLFFFWSGGGGSYSHHVFFILFDSSLSTIYERKEMGNVVQRWVIYHTITRTRQRRRLFLEWRGEGGPKINGGSDCVVIIIDHEKSNILAGHGQDETSNYNFSSFFVIIFLVWDFIKEKEKEKKRFGDRESS